MPTYILLTQFNADAIIEPQEMANLDTMVKKRVRLECPGVDWLDSYILLGRYDALDIFRTPDNQMASKVAVVIRSFGHATTEVLPATSWSEFAVSLEDLSAAEETANQDGKNLSQDERSGAQVGINASLTNHAEVEKSIRDEVDEAMLESFPASDPPSYNAG